MIAFENMAAIRCHDTRESERPGWGRLQLRIPPELWAELAKIPPERRGRMTLAMLADMLGVKLTMRRRGGSHAKSAK